MHECGRRSRLLGQKGGKDKTDRFERSGVVLVVVSRWCFLRRDLGRSKNRARKTRGLQEDGCRQTRCWQIQAGAKNQIINSLFLVSDPDNFVPASPPTSTTATARALSPPLKRRRLLEDDSQKSLPSSSQPPGSQGRSLGPADDGCIDLLDGLGLFSQPRKCPGCHCCRSCSQLSLSVKEQA